jgi:peptide/nickel transport system permease protein
MTDAAVNQALNADPVLAAKPENRVWKKFKRHKSAMVGGFLVAFFVIIALAAPILPIPDPSATDWGAVRKAPSWAHWMGTDEIGRDVMSRMIWGAQASLLRAISAGGLMP